MKTLDIAKQGLGITALSCIVLMAGSAQAHAWDHANPYLPVNVQTASHYGGHQGFDERFARDRVGRHEAVADIEQRQQRQMQRIRAGIDSGQLSRHEARDLLREQRQIEHAQRRYLADGRLSRDEWIHLDRMLDHAAVNIREEKHDRNRR